MTTKTLNKKSIPAFEAHRHFNIANGLILAHLFYEKKKRKKNNERFKKKKIKKKEGRKERGHQFLIRDFNLVGKFYFLECDN